MKTTPREKAALQAIRRNLAKTNPPVQPWAPGRPNWLWCETTTPGREDNVCGVLLPVGHRCQDCGKVRAPYAPL